jgi:hypothetical protein
LSFDIIQAYKQKALEAQSRGKAISSAAMAAATFGEGEREQYMNALLQANLQPVKASDS